MNTRSTVVIKLFTLLQTKRTLQIDYQRIWSCVKYGCPKKWTKLHGKACADAFIARTEAKSIMQQRLLPRRNEEHDDG